MKIVRLNLFTTAAFAVATGALLPAPASANVLGDVLDDIKDMLGIDRRNKDDKKNNVDNVVDSVNDNDNNDVDVDVDNGNNNDEEEQQQQTTDNANDGSGYLDQIDLYGSDDYGKDRSNNNDQGGNQGGNDNNNDTDNDAESESEDNGVNRYDPDEDDKNPTGDVDSLGPRQRQRRTQLRGGGQNSHASMKR